MLSEIKSVCLDLLFPPLCIHCKSFLEQPDPLDLCPECQRLIKSVAGPLCHGCGASVEGADYTGKTCPKCPPGSHHFSKIRSVLIYDGPVRTLIHQFKFRYFSRLAGPLAKYLIDYYERNLIPSMIDCIIPVPLHWTRAWRREFNQSELLAEFLSQPVGIPVVVDGLVRKKRTRPQTRFRGEKRQGNVAGAFKVFHPEKIRGRRLLLIDDIYTSGSTTNECCRILKEAGAEEIVVLTLARAQSGNWSRKEMAV